MFLQYGGLRVAAGLCTATAGKGYMKNSTLYVCFRRVMSWGILSPWHVWPVVTTLVIDFKCGIFFCIPRVSKRNSISAPQMDLDLRFREFPCKHGYTIRAADSEAAYPKQCALYVSPPLIVCQRSTLCPHPRGFPPAVRQLRVSPSGEFYLQLNSGPSPVIASSTGRARFIHYAHGKFQVPALRLRCFQTHSSSLTVFAWGC